MDLRHIDSSGQRQTAPFSLGCLEQVKDFFGCARVSKIEPLKLREELAHFGELRVYLYRDRSRLEDLVRCASFWGRVAEEKKALSSGHEKSVLHDAKAVSRFLVCAFDDIIKYGGVIDERSLEVIEPEILVCESALGNIESIALIFLESQNVMRLNLLVSNPSNIVTRSTMGAGSAIIYAIFKRCVKENVDVLKFDVRSSAVGFYQKIGFEVSDDRKVVIGSGRIQVLAQQLFLRLHGLDTAPFL